MGSPRKTPFGRNRPASHISASLCRRSIQHREVQGQDVGLTIRTSPPRVNSHGDCHVRPDRRRMTHRMSLEKKRLSAIKALEDARATKALQPADFTQPELPWEEASRTKRLPRPAGTSRPKRADMPTVELLRQNRRQTLS